jgi:hypothetical protein
MSVQEGLVVRVPDFMGLLGIMLLFGWTTSLEAANDAINCTPETA